MRMQRKAEKEIRLLRVFDAGAYIRTAAKILVVCLFVSLIPLFLPQSAGIEGITRLAFLDFEGNEAEDVNVVINEQVKGLDLSRLEEYFAGLEDSLKLFDGGIRGKIKAVISGEFGRNAPNVISAVLGLFFSGLTSLLPVLASIVAVCILCGIVTKLKSETFKGATSDAVFFACYSVIIITVLTSAVQCFTVAKEAVNNMAVVIELIMPLLITLLAATGGNVSARVYQPAVAMLSSGAVEIVSKIILPMFLISVALAVVSNLSANIRVTKLADFFKSSAVWILGVTFMIFTAFLAVQGLTASTIDGVSVRAVKFAARNYIPILGGYLSEGMDLILVGSILIKNALGVTGLALMLLTVVAPAVKILCVMFGLRLVSAIVEPIADERIVKFISTVANSLLILFVCIIAVAFMFLITVLLIIMTSKTFI